MTSFYPTTVLQTIVLKYGTKLVNGFIIGAGIILCALQVKTPPISPWRVINLHDDSAYPLQMPALFENFIVWRPFEENTLLYENFRTQTFYRYDWLHGNPVQWSVHLSDDQLYLVWRTEDNRLWVALLTPDGEQLTAPIPVASENVSDFRAAFYENDLFIVWQADQQLNMSRIDRAGRPRPAVILVERAEKFAFAGNTLAWQENNSLYAGEINALENRFPISTFSLKPDEILSTLQIVLTDTNRVIVWGVTQVMRPDVEIYAGVTLPADGFADPIPFQIVLPENPPLRWAAVSGQKLLLAAYLDKKWQPVQLAFGENGPTGFQVIEGAEVLASPPSAAGLHVAWATLDKQGLPSLYLTTLDSYLGKSVESPKQVKNPVWNGLKNSYRMGIWFILPVFAFLLTQRIDVTLAGYWLNKAIVSFGLFDRQPTYFFPPFNNVVYALLIITLLALVVRYIGWPKTPIAWSSYFLTDALLTFAVFGALL